MLGGICTFESDLKVRPRVCFERNLRSVASDFLRSGRNAANTGIVYTAEAVRAKDKKRMTKIFWVVKFLD